MLKYNINDKVLCHVKYCARRTLTLGGSTVRDDLYQFTIVGKNDNCVGEEFNYYLLVDKSVTSNIGWILDPENNFTDYRLKSEYSIDSKYIGKRIIGCYQSIIVPPLKYNLEQLDIGQSLSLYFDQNEFLCWDRNVSPRRVIPMKLVGINSEYFIFVVDKHLFKRRDRFHQLTTSDETSANIDKIYVKNRDNYSFFRLQKESIIDFYFT